MVRRDQRAHLSLVVEGVTHPEGLDRLLERLHEAVERRPLDEDPRSRTAILARVAEYGERRRRGGPVEIGIRKDDVRRLATKLQRHALDLLRGEGADAFADLGRPGEGYLGDIRVLDQPFADHPAGADQDVQNPFREARLERYAAELDRGQGGQTGRLQDD